MKSLFPLFSRTAGTGAAASASTIAALNERAADAVAHAESLAGQLAALTDQLATAQATLTEKETALATTAATLAEKEIALGAATATLATFDERVKSEAITLAAASGIPAGKTPPIQATENPHSRPTLTAAEFRVLTPREMTTFGKSGGRIQD